MKFCQNCGAQVPEGTAFCPTCGGAIADATQQAQTPVQPAAGQQYNGQQAQAGANPFNSLEGNDKACCILSYFGIIFGLIAMYGLKPKSEYAQFHTKQGLNLAIINIIATVISSIINSAGVPFVGPILSLAAGLIWVLQIIGLIWAVQGKKDEVPVLGSIKIIK